MTRPYFVSMYRAVRLLVVLQLLGCEVPNDRHERTESTRALGAMAPIDTAAISARMALGYELRRAGDPTAICHLDTTIMMAEAAGMHRVHANALVEKGQHLLNIGQVDEAWAQCEAGEAIAKRYGLLDMQGSAYNCYANVHRVRTDYEAALEMYDSALVIFKRLELMGPLAIALSNKGTTLSRMARFEESLTVAHEAMAIAESKGDSAGIAALLNNLGVIYSQFDKSEMAIEYFKNAYRHTPVSTNTRKSATILFNIGRTYRYIGQEDSARRYMRLSTDKLEQLTHRPDQAFGLRLQGEELQAMGRLQEAEVQLRRAMDIYEETGSHVDKNATIWRLAEVVAALGRPKEGIALAQEVLEAAKRQNAMEEILRAYSLLAQLYEGMGDADHALKYHKAYSVLNDSLVNLKSTTMLEELRTRYETEKKDRLLAEQDLLLAEGRVALERRGKLLRGVGMGAAALAVIALLAWRDLRRQARLMGERMRRLQSEQEAMAIKALLEGEERERQRVAAELHDGIGLLLSAARMRVDTDTPSGREKAGAILAEAASEVRRISHGLMPGTLSKLGLPDALRELADGLNGSGRIHVDVHAHGFRERLSPTVETGLYRIVQEALNNTVKHAHATMATVDLSVEDGRFVSLVVTDNGQGFDATSSSGSGHGTDNIRSRAALLGGSAVLHSTPGQGSQWEIGIPLQA